MIAFVVRRVFASIGVMIAVGLIAFAMFRYVGDPVNQMVGVETSVAERAQLREELGLNEPVIVQAARFLANAARFDFGVSYQFKQPVVGSDPRTDAGDPRTGVRRLDPLARGGDPDGRLFRLASRQRALKAAFRRFR